MGLQSTDLLEVYQSLVTRGVLKFDEAQVRCVMEVSRNGVAVISMTATDVLCYRSDSV